MKKELNQLILNDRDRLIARVQEIIKKEIDLAKKNNDEYDRLCSVLIQVKRLHG